MPVSKLNLAQVAVEIGGRTLAESELAALVEIRVRQQLSLPDQCELTFADQFGQHSLISYLVAGLTLTVAGAGVAEPLFTGEVTALEYGYDADSGQTMRVRGYSALHHLRKRQPLRSFVQVGLLDLARELVSDLGLTVTGSTPEVLWRRILQHGQSDFELLRERARAAGVYFTQRGSALQFLTLKGLDETVPLQLGDSLLEARIEVNGEPACRSVSVQGWNPAIATAHHGKSADATVTRTAPAHMAPDTFGESGERSLVARILESDRAADAAAQAILDEQVAREVTLWGVADGNPALRPGTVVELGGVAPSVAGRYVLTETTHVMNADQRFTTEISTAPPPAARAGSGVTAVLGKVSSVDDPERLGRVQVTLPSSGDLETDWMQVLAPGAGAAKGLMMLPDVGDVVLVLCFEGDFAQGIVLGGLYGASGPMDAGVESGRAQRFSLRTPGGRTIQFDDANQIVRLGDASGNLVELLQGKVRLAAAGDLEISAPGRTIVIKGKAINFEEG